ncbi:MAG TPA: dienelactone hydrolase family protein [Caulobacteraceae bacterium]|jgi:carboxymethylenebutenolidase|nr:dienelactone hydrolase family protein [Caulobacteraceae bacterium]
MGEATAPEANDDRDLSRRRFAALSVAAGMAPAVARAQINEVVETDVTVGTADGMADAALFHPQGAGRWPGVVLFTSALGLRPVFRDMARRLASNGYTVLVPNPFYRLRKGRCSAPSISIIRPTWPSWLNCRSR